MGGLQNSLMTRSKSITGSATILFHNTDQEFVFQVNSFLTKRKLFTVAEYSIELLMRHGNYISPVLVHGIDFSKPLPEFLQERSYSGALLGAELANKVQAGFYSTIKLVSPSHVNSILGDIPRQVTTSVEDYVVTEVPEVDSYHMWTRLSLIQNLIRERALNRILIYIPAYGPKIDWKELKSDLYTKFSKDDLEFKTWEDMHASLVWALGLETIVMLSLFIGMSFLVAISITSGFMIFFGKIKVDLISFWILGTSKKRLKMMSKIFLHVLSFSTCLFGILCSLLFLFLLKKYGGGIMPDIFVERSIPVFITAKGVLISFFIPYIISIVFSHFSLQSFANDEDRYLAYIRSIG